VWFGGRKVVGMGPPSSVGQKHWASAPGVGPGVPQPYRTAPHRTAPHRPVPSWSKPAQASTSGGEEKEGEEMGDWRGRREREGEGEGEDGTHHHLGEEGVGRTGAAGVEARAGVETAAGGGRECSAVQCRAEPCRAVQCSMGKSVVLVGDAAEISCCCRASTAGRPQLRGLAETGERRTPHHAVRPTRAAFLCSLHAQPPARESLGRLLLPAPTLQRGPARVGRLYAYDDVPRGTQ